MFEDIDRKVLSTNRLVISKQGQRSEQHHTVRSVTRYESV